MVLVALVALLNIAWMDAFFKKLGRTVLDRWKQVNFSLAAFPEIAQKALDERPPSENVDMAALVREFLLEDEQPLQTASGFGQPELVAYDHPRFYIQILFWLDGTTDIHQHEFSGAFHVLAGSSIHSHFEFENAQPVTAHFRLGDLRLKDTQLLETGCTVPIVSGKTCIHSLFHLDTPSVTVVVRTHSDPGTGPQFNYLPPHVALDPFHHDALTMRRKQLLDVLEQTGDPEYPALVLEMIAELDFERAFFILQNCMGHLRNLEAWEEVWDAFTKKHGRMAGMVEPTLKEIIRRDGIAALRGNIEEIEHRFFLALLLNVSEREGILEMVGQRYPGDALETALRWAEELSEMPAMGTWILDAHFPEALDVPEDEQQTVFLAALRYFIKGGKAPAELKGLAKKEVAELRAAFMSSSWRALILAA